MLSVDAALDARLRGILQPVDGHVMATPQNAEQMRAWFGLEHLRDAAVLVGLVPRAAGVHVLLTVRHAQLRQHGGQVAFPGGAMDPEDADVVATALRETQEELGIAAADITPVGILEPLATISGFRVFPVVAWVKPGAHVKPDPHEVDAVFEVPFAAVMERANLGFISLQAGGAERQVPEYRLPLEVSPYRIWGATAIMLGMLRQRLEDAP